SQLKALNVTPFPRTFRATGRAHYTSADNDDIERLWLDVHDELCEPGSNAGSKCRDPMSPGRSRWLRQSITWPLLFSTPDDQVGASSLEIPWMADRGSGIFHALIPQQNGSRSSKTSIPSLVTKAVPLMQGAILPA